MIKLFEESGSRCKNRSGEEDMSHDIKKYDINFWCEYNSDWLSFNPLGVYEIWFIGNKNYKLVDLYGSTYPALVI